MCIRDRDWTDAQRVAFANDLAAPELRAVGGDVNFTKNHACLLYTSDAADERSSVDLGGPRIITKKTTHISTQRLQLL